MSYLNKTMPNICTIVWCDKCTTVIYYTETILLLLCLLRTQKVMVQLKYMVVMWFYANVEDKNWSAQRQKIFHQTWRSKKCKHRSEFLLILLHLMAFQLDCNPSQVKSKSNLRLVASLLLHSQWFSSFSFHQL